MSTPLPISPGDVLAGKYRVERVLGSGGMGYVVAARHLQLDQMVAMKFLRKNAEESSEAGKRFIREAKAAVKLRNEHIARVYDVGTLDTGEPYIVMEYLEGYDLSALTKQRNIIPVNEASEYILQACEALAEAHSLGIIHRDIKLANLFVARAPDGGPLVKVLDFGISKTNPFGESEHDMTRTASMLGSPRFMSPEQMRDPRAVDGRTDIWSLGVVLYRLVSGRAPFDAETLGRLLTMVMHEPEPPLSSLRNDLPPGFDQVVARCLQKDPNARFSTMAELALALVPYTMDPARAHSTALRIAAVQSIPLPGAATGPLQPPSMHPSSTPNRTSRLSIPAAVENGTASPWSHTQARPRSSTTVLLVAALVAVVLGAGVIAAVRFGSSKSSAAAASAPPDTAAAFAKPPTPSTTASGAAPVTLGSGNVPTLLGASSPEPPATNTQPQPPATQAKRPMPTSTSRSKPARSPSEDSPTPTSEEIPTTRD